MNERVALIERRERCLAQRRSLVHEIRALDARLGTRPDQDVALPRKSGPAGLALFLFCASVAIGVAYLVNSP